MSGAGRAFATASIPVLLVLALLVAGCASQGGAGAAPSSAGATSGAPVTSVAGSGSAALGSSSGGAGDSGAGAGAARLAGRTFLSSSVTGHDLVAGSGISLAFDTDGRLVANAGCNTMSGSYRLDGGRLTVGDLATTEMGCDKPLMDQDGWLSDLLGAGLTATLNGDTLTLTGDGVTLHLTDRKVADPDRPLQGTTWRLDGIVSGTGPSSSVSSVPQGIAATLRIAGGKIHFFDGLNDYDGPVGSGAALTIGPDTVTIHGDIAGSAVGCASGSTCSVDMSVLRQDFHYQITADRLTVTGIGTTADKGLMFVSEDTGSVTANPPHIPASPVVPPSVGSGTRTEEPGAPGDGSPGSAGGTLPAPTAESGPAVAPGSMSALTSGATARPTLGRHDSIPPQPSPAGAPESSQR